MHDPICQVVSRAFYPEKEADAATEDLPEGTLVTMRPEDGHVITTPDWLADHTLVWLDTSGMRQEEGYWSNRYEAGLIKALVEKMRPRPLLNARPDKAGRRGLAILTPYRRQVEVIKDVDPRLADAVRTVDSFQGREADVVIVSLVRDNVRASWDRPVSNIGHLADPSRVNVMLSRARDLQIIVGSFDHFAGSEVESWQLVTKAVTQFGIKLSADTMKRA
jgi:hypothetical protein